jgi:hypothetical protein
LGLLWLVVSASAPDNTRNIFYISLNKPSLLSPSGVFFYTFFRFSCLLGGKDVYSAALSGYACQ